MELTFKNMTLYQEKLNIIKFKFKTKRGLMAKNNIILFRQIINDSEFYLCMIKLIIIKIQS